MACSEGRKLAAYLDAELPLPERARLEEHLTHCSCCRQELAELEQLEGLLAELAPLPAPPHLVGATMARASAELRTAQRPAANWSARFAAMSAAAALLLVVLQFGLHETPSPVYHPVVASIETAPAMPMAVLPPRAPVTTARIIPRHQQRNASLHRTRAITRVAHTVTKTTAIAVAETAAPPAVEAVAAAAYQQASGHAARDPELSVAALENVAAAYPRSRQAAKALLAAGSLERRCGNLTDADVTYRRVLALPAQTGLSQGLAHKALGDMRRESVGDDEVALYHYQQAARALRRETSQHTGPRTQALVVLADVERQMGQRDRAAADYATVANSSLKSTLGEQTTAALAEVL